MNSASYLGFNEWRLPSIQPVDGVSFNYSNSFDGSTDQGSNIGAPGSVYEGTIASEMAYLFYNTLGNQSPYDLDGTIVGCPPSPTYCLTNTGPFSIQSIGFWIGTEHLNSDAAFYFGFRWGQQGGDLKSWEQDYQAWAIADGDPFAAVPVPAALWMFGSGLLLLLGIARSHS